MKKDSQKLLFIAVVAFISFLIAFAYVFYLYGAYRAIGELIFGFILPIYYFILTVVALVMMHGVIITKRPYIVMSILSTALMLVIWGLNFGYMLASGDKSDFGFNSELYIPIVLTVLSLIMSLCYISLIIDIVKVDKKIKKEQSDK